MDEQVIEPVDVFSMSDEEFANLNLNSLNQESATADSSNVEIQDEQTQEEVLSETDTDIDGDLNGDLRLDEEEEDESTESQEVLGDSEHSEESTEPSSEVQETETEEVNYEELFKQIVGSPIKANGSEITINSVEEAQRLIQMGANYYNKMESLKPARQVIAMLEANEMMDTEKLSFAIDLINKNPQAINKLIADQDLSEIINDESKDQYKPTDYSVSEQQLNVTEALEAIKHTETYAQTVNVLGNQWDSQSRDIITQNPEVIAKINSQIADGSFDKVSAEVQRRRLFGSIPQGTPDILAYKMVGDELYASNVPQQQNVEALKANAPKPPIRKPKQVVRQEKLATTTPRGKANITEQFEDVFNMPSDDFIKKFGSI